MMAVVPKMITSPRYIVIFWNATIYLVSYEDCLPVLGNYVGRMCMCVYVCLICSASERAKHKLKPEDDEYE